MHGIWVILDAHPNWVVFEVDVVNIFNTISHKSIFKELQAQGGQLFQLFSFVHSFYGFQVPLFFNYHSSLGGLFIILPYVCTCQGNLLVGLLFALTYFCVLHYF